MQLLLTQSILWFSNLKITCVIRFRTIVFILEFDSEEEEEQEDLLERKDWDRFDTVLRQAREIPACGYGMQNGSMITKHDMALSGRKNAFKIMSFPPEFQTGDGAGFDLKLPNQVFNR